MWIILEEMHRELRFEDGLRNAYLKTGLVQACMSCPNRNRKVLRLDKRKKIKFLSALVPDNTSTETMSVEMLLARPFVGAQKNDSQRINLVRGCMNSLTRRERDLQSDSERKIRYPLDQAQGSMSTATRLEEMPLGQLSAVDRKSVYQRTSQVRECMSYLSKRKKDSQ